MPGETRTSGRCRSVRDILQPSPSIIIARPISSVAYAHGFLSSAQSSKGRFLRERLARHGIDLELLTLNGGAGPAALTPQSALDALQAHWQRAGGVPLTLVGSSFGGWAAARYAELHPGRVRRLLLLNPGFELGRRWECIVGTAALEAWRRDGARTFAMPSTGEPCQVPWSFVEQTRAEAGTPAVSTEAVVLHGRRDEVVPPSLSEAFVHASPLARLVLLDDDHALTAPPSLERIAREALAACGGEGGSPREGGPPAPSSWD